MCNGEKLFTFQHFLDFTDERIDFIYELIKETQSVEITRELILDMDVNYLKETFNLKEISKQEVLEWAQKRKLLLIEFT